MIRLYLPKSFKMMKLLNYNHGGIIRGLTASLAYVAVLFATQRNVLAKDLAGCFWIQNDFKRGARRGAWYAQGTSHLTRIDKRVGQARD